MIRTPVKVVRPISACSWRKDLPILLRCSQGQRQALSNLVQKKRRSGTSRRARNTNKDGPAFSPENLSRVQAPRDLENPFATPVHTADTQTEERPTVRWYHQLTPWSKERKLSDPENPDAADDTGMVKRVKQQIDRLDAELKAMEDRPLEPLIRQLPSEDKRLVEEEIRKADLQQQKENKELQSYLPKLEIRWMLPIEQKSYLKELNDNIKESLLAYENYSVRRKLWRSYARCKSFLPPFFHLVPEEAWSALYRAQAEAAARDDAHWASHLIVLIEDMRAAGRQLSPDQIVMHIEALRFEHLIEDAIIEWEALRRFVDDDTRLLAEYELLGVRLFTSQGDLATAERIASKYLNSDVAMESRILIPIMDTWIERRDEVGMKHAWALYLTIKMQLGSSMTMLDYDTIGAKFMNCGRTDLALAIFKDMMLTGLESGHDSVALYKRHHRRLHQLTDSTNKIPEVNQLYLTSLTVVPKEFQNKFFYAKWLKKLLGLGEADAAAAVIELMYERNVKPDAKHLNGILGAWFRSSNDANKVRAENIAWSMINQRLSLVQRRTRDDSARIQEFVDKACGKGLATITSKEQSRSIPSATVETYALLLQFYTRRSRFLDVQTLHEAFDLGQMQPNSYWTNHLLWMLLRQHKLSHVWSLFLSRFDHIVPPDFDTFDCLWQSEEKHLKNSKTITADADDFPSPRTVLSHQLSARTCGKPPLDLYETIIRCFMRNQDLAGTIVAMHILRERFDLYPSVKVVRDIVQLVAQRILKPLGAQEHSYAGHRSRPAQSRKAESIASEMLKQMQQERAKRLVAAGFDDLDSLNDNIQQRERLATMVDFLKHVMQRMMNIEDVDAHIEEAASEMGLAGVNTVDYLYSEHRV